MTPPCETPASGVNRRAILTASGVAAAVAAVLHAKGAQAFQATPEEKAPRYQDSAHVQRFYALNRR